MIVRRMSSSELYHHGIKGQKWGVRRYQNYDRSYTPAGKGRYSNNKKNSNNGISPETKKKLKIALAAVGGLTLLGATAYLGYKVGNKGSTKLPNVNKMLERNESFNKKEATKSKVSSMTDDQLLKAIKRKKMEKEYASLANPKVKSSGLQINKILERTANATLTTLMAGLTGYTIRTAITGDANRETLADYVAPKPKTGRKR